MNADTGAASLEEYNYHGCARWRVRDLLGRVIDLHARHDAVAAVREVRSVGGRGGVRVRRRGVRGVL